MQTPSASRSDPSPPYLEHYPEPGGAVHRILLDKVPYRIGRSTAANFSIFSRQVSKEHAEIVRVGEDYRIRDLGSTNGTHVNGQRVVETTLHNGDIIHIAHKEFRYGQDNTGRPEDDAANLITESASSAVPRSLIEGGMHLRDLLALQRVNILFQPIVDLDTRITVAYEALGRGASEQLSPSPAELFRLAEQCRLAPELSRLFRMTAVQEACLLPGTPDVFINLHPAEMEGDSLLNSLREVSSTLQDHMRVVLELHEDAVANLQTVRRLREHLKELGMGLAYDDMGAGQSRLAHLAEVPPDFIKLDMNLVRGIDQSRARQELVQAITTMSMNLGVRVIAEGIETAAEAATCHRLGCRYGQGYLFCRPAPVTEFVQAKRPDTRRMDLSELRRRLTEQRV